MITRSGAPYVLLSAEPLVQLWHRVHISLNRTLYQDYVEHFIDVVYNNGSASGGASESYLQFLRTRSAYVQNNVFEELSAPTREQHPLPVHGYISELSDFVPMFSAKDWTSALAAAYDATTRESTAVYVSSRGLLDSMKALLSAFSALELLYHTAWWFLQQIATFTSNELYAAATATFGAHGSLHVKVLCAVQVSITYHALVADNFWVNRTDADREAVRRILRALQDTVRNATRVSSAAGLPVRSLLYMLDETRPVAWPEAPLDFRSGLLLLYGEAVDSEHGFFGHWLSSHRMVQASYGRSWHKAAGLVYRLDTSALSTYSAARGVISLATAAAEPPFYYNTGTPAMAFGGLGFVYALRLLLAMDVTVLLNSAALGSLVVADDHDHLARLLACSDHEEKYAAFPFLPALEAAHAAYVQSVSGTVEPRLKGLEDFTAEQVFFMTMCLSLCQEDGAGRRSSPPCNAAARNFAPFAAAFRCTDKSAMNPAEKCRFLGSDHGADSSPSYRK
ncbi:uncharacterized protein LOC119448773 [Dermacentor silvarum]|uniref:uncharacterized protein LOC119448773 n=1 Tax=Dermacentor silvarum TaxID=543639 RepID=UPI0021016AC3|nr:uncharacterized protein LOC119448773 [Dermacentor silvarum]